MCLFEIIDQCVVGNWTVLMIFPDNYDCHYLAHCKNQKNLTLSLNIILELFIVIQVSLIVLLLLTVVTLSLGAQASLPHLSYIKAVDIWMVVCTFNICATLGILAAGTEI